MPGTEKNIAQRYTRLIWWSHRTHAIWMVRPVKSSLDWQHVTTVSYDDTPENDIAMITYDTGGDAVTEDIKLWKCESVIGRGGNGVGYLGSYAATGHARP